jgi:outer membrane protein assembly factor BamB
VNAPANRTRRAWWTRVLRVLAVMVTVLALLESGVLAVVTVHERRRAPDRGDPAATGTALWSLPGESGSGLPWLGELPGTWLTDRALVRLQPDGVLGHDRRTGRRLWGVPVPGADDVACAGVGDPGAAIAVVAYGPPGRCAGLLAVDLRTGRPLWTVQLPGDLPDGEPTLAMSQGVVLVRWSTGGTHAYRASDGRALWSRERVAPGGCTDDRFVGGRRLVLAISCGSQEGAAAVDPASGAVRWSWQAPGSVIDVYSADPPVLAVAGDNRLLDRFVVLDGSGHLRAQIPARHPGEQKPYVATPTPRTFSDSPPGVVITSDTLFVATRPVVHGGQQTDQVAAFDLHTGARRWLRDAGAGSLLVPVRAQGGALLAYDRRTFGGSSRLLRLSPDGTQEVLRIYAGEATAADIDTSRPLVGDDSTVFLVDETPVARGDHRVIALG